MLSVIWSLILHLESALTTEPSCYFKCYTWKLIYHLGLLTTVITYNYLQLTSSSHLFQMIFQLVYPQRQQNPNYHWQSNNSFSHCCCKTALSITGRHKSKQHYSSLSIVDDFVSSLSTNTVPKCQNTTNVIGAKWGTVQNLAFHWESFMMAVIDEGLVEAGY